MLNYSNPYDVLSETISFENVQLMGEMITLKTLRTRYAYARKALDWLYVGLVKDLNRGNDSEHVFSDAYDLVQNAICFLCEFIGKSLNDVYTIKNGRLSRLNKLRTRWLAALSTECADTLLVIATSTNIRKNCL